MVERCLTEEILGAELDGPSHYPAEMFTILNEIVVDRGPNPSIDFYVMLSKDRC